SEGRLTDEGTDPAAVAAHDEVLEDEPAAGSGELVGADGLASRRAGTVGVEAAQVERTRLHVAALHVRQRAAGAADGEDGQDPPRPPAVYQNTQGAAGDDQAAPASVPPRRLRRPSGPAGHGCAATGPAILYFAGTGVSVGRPFQGRPPFSQLIRGPERAALLFGRGRGLRRGRVILVRA